MKTRKQKPPTEITIPSAKKLTPEQTAELLPSTVSKYAPILDAMRALKPGESVSFPFNQNVDVRALITRLTSAIVNAEIAAPEGCSFFKRVGKGNELVITAKLKKPGRKAKAKS